MSWDAVTAIASTVSMVAFVLTAVYLRDQLKGQQKDRFLAVTNDLFTTWQSREFMEAQLWLIHTLERDHLAGLRREPPGRPRRGRLPPRRLVLRPRRDARPARLRQREGDPLDDRRLRDRGLEQDRAAGPRGAAARALGAVRRLRAAPARLPRVLRPLARRRRPREPLRSRDARRRPGQPGGRDAAPRRRGAVDDPGRPPARPGGAGAPGLAELRSHAARRGAGRYAEVPARPRGGRALCLTGRGHERPCGALPPRAGLPRLRPGRRLRRLA